MKKYLFALIICCLYACGKKESDPNDQWLAPIRIASYNIQYDNTVQAPASVWNNRKDIFKKLVERHDFDIIGAQEPYLVQLNDLKTLLPQYAYVGVSITGETSNLRQHYTPIIYKKDKFEVLDWGTFWYSPNSTTPGSIGWDAYSPRICTRALMKDKTTGKIFTVLNSHLDHIGTTARDLSVQMLLSLIPAVSAKYPVILTGDFNFNQTSVNYSRIMNSGLIKDSYNLAKSHTNKERGTHNNYDLNSNTTTRIDHIFLSTGNGYAVKSHNIITDDFEGKYPSDHFPVMIELLLKK